MVVINTVQQNVIKDGGGIKGVMKSIINRIINRGKVTVYP
jgi:hypothetical protein